MLGLRLPRWLFFPGLFLLHFLQPFLGSRSVSTILILSPSLHPAFLLLTSCSLLSVCLMLSLFCPLSLLLCLQSPSSLCLPTLSLSVSPPSHTLCISHPLPSVALPFPSLSLFLSCHSTFVTLRGWLPAQDWEDLSYEGPVRPGGGAKVCPGW